MTHNLQRKSFFVLTMLALTLAFTACATTRQSSALAPGGGSDAYAILAGVLSVEWQLKAIEKADGAVQLDRSTDFSKDNFTLTVTQVEDGEGSFILQGRAAPNRYRAPLEVEDGAITMSPAVSTMMASIFESPDLKENEYYAHLAGIYAVGMKGSALVLYTQDAGGKYSSLVFERAQSPE